MKLNLEMLARYAEKNALRNDYELSQELGIRRYLIRATRKGMRIGYDAVMEFYNRNGEAMTVEFIDFEGESLNGFKAKFVQIGDKLY